MPRLTYVVVHTSDINRSTAFYRDMMGLRVRFHSPSWVELQTEGVRLALSPAAAPAAAPAGGVPRAGLCSLIFQVDDLEWFHQEAVKRGIHCLRSPAFDDLNLRQAVYLAPDDVTITVRERHSIM